MTEQNLKDILKIEEWSEVNKPQQFLGLMSHYYELAPGIKKKILTKIPDMNGLAERFSDYCASGIIEYEPSIMMIISKLSDDMKAVTGASGQIRGDEKKEKLSLLCTTFSEWFGRLGEVKCTLNEKDFECNISEAIKLAKDNEKNDKQSELSMTLLTADRISMMRDFDEKLLQDTDIDLDFLTELFGDDVDIEIETKNKSQKYIN